MTTDCYKPAREVADWAARQPIPAERKHLRDQLVRAAGAARRNHPFCFAGCVQRESDRVCDDHGGPANGIRTSTAETNVSTWTCPE